MVTDTFLARVIAMLGDPPAHHADPAAWAALETDLGFSLPEDFKTLVDGYAPVKVNGHLYLDHPATDRWNLGTFIRETSEAWNQIPWDDDIEGDPRAALGLADLEFGTERGLTPIASADSGQTVFFARSPEDGRTLLFVEDGDGEFSMYSMSLSEWLYRYLVGEDMAGPNSSYFYPGPVVLESRPMEPDEEIVRRHGPERGM
ncbi:SMI1/KNR4 family protein [Streptomyces sp. NPDC026092]|uniref:SMI1/KNR4 family protein n=1 Tax=Streptomyces sp. NPDC026092 TaxID=3154797 RepID=UPI0033DFB333